jgi:hypothetical protein
VLEIFDDNAHLAASVNICRGRDRDSMRPAWIGVTVMERMRDFTE